jgi:prepilin-type N-terminal cleavage/methylation domain-containing protein
MIGGFILIELLVVIAIIAILAAILFPVFGRVREKARQTACANSQKQIATAVLLYAQDHDDELPGVVDAWQVLGVDAAVRKCPSKPTLDNGYGYNAMVARFGRPRAKCLMPRLSVVGEPAVRLPGGAVVQIVVPYRRGPDLANRV